MSDTIGLVTGVGSHNGGAELMLRAAADALRTMGLTPAVDMKRVAPEVRRRWGVERFVSVARAGRAEHVGLNLVPAPVARAARVYSSRHVGAVLDASGFYLGDQWAPHVALRTAALYEYWHRRGVPVVMLPQAFGPFTDPAVAAAARRVVATASVVFARDEESFEHVAALADTHKVRLAPDFTALLTPAGPSQRAVRSGVAVVPNVNILRTAGRDEYVGALTRTCTGLVEAGHDVVVLVHSTAGDPGLAREVAAAAGVAVVQPADGLAAKELIGRCAGLVGGRYHALASALSQGVPVVAHSWSHKYRALLADFGVGHDRVLDPTDAAGTTAALLADMADPAVRDRIARAADDVRDRNRAMWAAVARVVDGKSLGTDTAAA